VDALWLLGDIFHYGWDFPDEEQADFEAVFEALDRFASRGGLIRFVPGNHDFAMGSLMKRRWAATVRGPHICVVDGTRFYLGHGDELDARFRYRMTQYILRSRLFFGSLSALGSRLGTEILRRLAGSEPSFGQAIWPPVMQGLQDQLAHADVAIVGHLHSPLEQRRNDGLLVVLAPGVSGARFIVDGEVVQ
jgi:UDP-2,3-diacylglucosamine pyrophosphatase LpxH